MVAVACVLVFAISSVVATERLARNPISPCSLNTLLVPSCGALWGVTAPQASYESLQSAEQAVGRRFDLVYSFHDINDAIPSDYDRQIIASGSQLHISIDARDYTSRDLAVNRWSAVASGAYDKSLTAQARGIASLRQPVFVTFDHEPDQPAKSAQGTPEEFVAAWRHVHDLFERTGATNAVWVWVVMGWHATLPTALRMWPGDDEVDWISWEGYNHAGCLAGRVDRSMSQAFADVVLPAYDYFREHGLEVGMDPSKPIMISETGTVPLIDAQENQKWYNSIPTFLTKHPQIKAVSVWDHTGAGACEYRLNQGPGLTAGVAAAGRAAWLNPLAAWGANSSQ